MELISVIPRGYCQGVVRAIQTAVNTVKEYPDTPVTMLGMIVHNAFVVEECRKLGIRFVEDPARTRLELLDEIDEGVVIFTAHGVCDAVKQKAKEKGLIVVDATCKDVEKTHEAVRNHPGDVVYIGKKNHPEAEGTTGLKDNIWLVSSLSDIDSLPDLHDVLITCQTTLSLHDLAEIVARLKEKYPDARLLDEICNATRIRQEAVMHLKDTDVLIVVGDRRSNNSRQLAAIAQKAGIPEAWLIDSAMDLREEMLKGKNRIAVTSGSSTPNDLTRQVIAVIQNYIDTGILSLPDHISCGLL